MSVDVLAPEEPLRRPRLAFGIAHLRSALAAQEGAYFAWVPVCLTIGIWLYFAWADEPSTTLVAVLAIVASCLATLWVRTRNPLLLGVCLVLVGFGLAKFRTEWVRAPVLPATTGEISCGGTVTGVEARRGSHVSLTVDVSSLSGIARTNTPTAIRLLAPDRPMINPGDRIKARCRLFPPPAPVSPGGFDYARTLWFEGIGATGRILGPVEIISREESVANIYQAWLQDLRTQIGERIRGQLKGDIGAIGEALITGERAEISREANTNLQISGLAHVLSISGLHMSLVAGGVFALVRALLALSPALALRRPIKKWAAFAALLAGFAYLLLSGNAVATQRSYIMLAIMFLAILIDRPALSTRNLTLAALFILVVEPEAAISASFQMSFLAVVGLVSFYDFWSNREREERAESQAKFIVILQRAIRVVLLAAATTLIAGTLSSIPAVYHFGRASPYSLIANLLATPVIGILMMPMALASTLLMPFGLDYWPLQIMGEGIRLMLAISDWVSELPGARLYLPTMPLLASILLAGAALFLCLLRGPLRFPGLLLIPCAVLIAMNRNDPDILVERTASNVAVLTDKGVLAFANTRRGRFAAEKWLQANGEEARLSPASNPGAWTCAGGVCLAATNGFRIAYVDEATAITKACPTVDILIARFPLRGSCEEVPVTIDRFDVWRNGSYALSIDAGKIVQRTSRTEQGERPWTVKPIARRDLDKEDPDAVQ